MESKMKLTYLILALCTFQLTFLQPTTSHANTGIGAFERDQSIEILVDQILNQLQGSAEYNSKVRPASIQSAKLSSEFYNYLFSLRQSLSSPDYLNGNDAQKMKDRSEARLALEVYARTTARGL